MFVLKRINFGNIFLTHKLQAQCAPILKPDNDQNQYSG